MKQLDNPFLTYISSLIHGRERIFLYVFFVFLKQERIYDLFMREFKQRKNSTNFYAHQRCPNPKDLIVDAFCWSDTAHGHNFWLEMETKWRDMLRSYDLL